MQALTGFSATTISRYVIGVAHGLCSLALAGTPPPRSTLIVDSTSIRVACTESKAYSGYKHHRRAKVQVVTHKDRRIVAVSQSYPGSVHDEKIWNMEAANFA
ncbi:transposase family protein [Cupriavidus sp. AcVe19-6a]|uniref:transposase family protein n=1 Tax=Cupriavidus sp. AcVe19-6a TaxID=2821358 RepID=UPI001FD78D5D|nr:transposase family protein [Cupriavidus sp. AcVe19-6a]